MDLVLRRVHVKLQMEWQGQCFEFNEAELVDMVSYICMKNHEEGQEVKIPASRQDAIDVLVKAGFKIRKEEVQHVQSH